MRVYNIPQRIFCFKMIHKIIWSILHFQDTQGIHIDQKRAIQCPGGKKMQIIHLYSFLFSLFWELALFTWCRSNKIEP